MQGIAQQLFIKKYRTSPWKRFSFQGPSSPAWPLLEEMVSVGAIGYVDLALAQRILKQLFPVSHPDENAFAALLCLLSTAARQGNLCVKINRESIIPPLQEVWQYNSDEKDFSAHLEELQRLICSVHHHSSVPGLIADVSETFNSIPITPIYRNGEHYYFQRNWLTETFFISHLRPLLERQKLSLSVDMNQIKTTVDHLIRDKILLPEQGLAVIEGCQSPFTIITGGPGTGKTHTAGIFLRTFLEGLSDEARASCRIVLAAPTGKAATNLEQSIRRAISEEVNLTAQTLHRLLKTHKKEIWQQEMPPLLDADIVIVDESSMIDVRLMGLLVASIKPGARLILLGDSHQLPPVEMGSLFSDLVDCLRDKGHLIELKKCLRAEMQSILDIAEAIKQGDATSVTALLNTQIKYKPLDGTLPIKEMQRELVLRSQSHFPHVDSIPENPSKILEAFKEFRILSPLKQGPLGTDQLNDLFLAAAALKGHHAPCYAVPIMITRNHHQLELFNGEMGLLIKFNANSRSNFAIFSGTENAKTRKIPISMLPEFEYAYCISVHKSQGSEFNHVLMLLPEGAEAFGREALYTGVTRAKRSLEIWSAPAILNHMINKKSSRISGIKERLKK